MIPLINPISLLITLDLTTYLFMAFAFYGVFLLLRQLIFTSPRKGVRF